MENCLNYILMFYCPPIAGRRSQIALNCCALRTSEWLILKHYFKPTNKYENSDHTKFGMIISLVLDQ